MMKKLLSTTALIALTATSTLAQDIAPKNVADSDTYTIESNTSIKTDTQEIKEDAERMYDHTKRSAAEAVGLRVSQGDLGKARELDNSRLENAVVYSENNQRLGKVADVLVTDSGDEILVISSGGVLGLGDTLYVIFEDRAEVTGESQLKLKMNETEFKNQPQVKRH